MASQSTPSLQRSNAVLGSLVRKRAAEDQEGGKKKRARVGARGSGPVPQAEFIDLTSDEGGADDTERKAVAPELRGASDNSSSSSSGDSAQQRHVSTIKTKVRSERLFFGGYEFAIARDANGVITGVIDVELVE